MKKSFDLVLSISLIILLSGCSSVNVLNSWKGDNVSAIMEKNVIVIARTDNNKARTDFENEIVKQLSARGIKATASYTKFPKLNPDQEVTEERKAEIIASLLKQGFNAVVLTVVKDVEEMTKGTYEEAHYSGGTYYGYYPRYYGGLYTYYNNPSSYSTLGNYEAESFTVQTANNYVLETVIYDLDETDEKQLVAVVTSKIEDPENVSVAAKQYVKAIAKSFDDKK
jgi:hypothetical protein